MDAARHIEGFEIPVHRALTEPILLGGAPRAVAILNGTLAAAIGLGLQQWIAGLGLFGHGTATLMRLRYNGNAAPLRFKQEVVASVIDSEFRDNVAADTNDALPGALDATTRARAVASAPAGHAVPASQVILRWMPGGWMATHRTGGASSCRAS